MAELLKGKPVADALLERCRAQTEKLKEKGITPTLAIVRCGEDPSDLSYEKGAMKRCEAAGVAVKNIVMPADVDSETFYKNIADANHDPSIHGILMFRPVPKQRSASSFRKAPKTRPPS